MTYQLLVIDCRVGDNCLVKFKRSFILGQNIIYYELRDRLVYEDISFRSFNIRTFLLDEQVKYTKV